MQSKLFRITLNSAQPDLLLRFYGVLGFKFSQKAVDKGSQTWLGQVGDISLEVYSIKESLSKKIPGVQMSFQVNALEDVVKQFRALHAEIMVEPLPTNTGLIAIVMDPDGRSIELSENL